MPATLLPLKTMSRADKLREMEALWADLSEPEAGFESPAWHKEELKKTEARVAVGRARFSDWAEAKERLRRKTARVAP
jgi:hypothetical protein